MSIASVSGAIGLVVLLLLVVFPVASPALYIIAGIMFLGGMLNATERASSDPVKEDDALR